MIDDKQNRGFEERGQEANGIHPPPRPMGLDEDGGGPPAGAKRTAAPSGMRLDLHPRPEGAVRVKKSIGMAVAIVGCVLLMLIAIGIATHKGVSGKPQKEKAGRVQSALAPGQEIADKLEKRAQERAAATGEDGADVGDDLNVPPMKVVAHGAGNGGKPKRAGDGPSAAGLRPLTPEQAAIEDEQKAERAAIFSPISAKAASVGGGAGGMLNSVPGLGEKLGALNTLGNSLESALANGGSLLGGAGGSGLAGAGLAPGGVGQGDDQNRQDEKSSFLEKAKGHSEAVYLNSTRTPAITPFEIKAGWDIPATLEQGINSDLPGEVRGLVRENVYDTATGRYLLIPQGSRLLGTYNHRIAYGQTGIQVIWTRLIFPDGSSVNLEGMSGEDARGQSGFRDKVDNHYVRLVAFALLTSAFSAGVELTQNQSATGAYPTASQTVTQALGQQLGELGITITNRNLNIQPTIKISVGYRFNVRVDRDIAFTGPYSSYP